MNSQQLFEIHKTATLLMVGIIWMVQVVHYPLMEFVGEPQFQEYSEKNQRWTTWVVIGPMLFECVTGGLLLIKSSELRSSVLFWISLGLLAAIWLSTAFLQVPLHTKFLTGFSVANVRMLVLTNWIRTLSWTMRATLLAVISYRT